MRSHEDENFRSQVDKIYEKTIQSSLNGHSQKTHHIEMLPVQKRLGIILKVLQRRVIQ